MITPKHYDYLYKGVKLDPYRISVVYEIHHPAQQQILKKVLRAGKKSSNDIRKEIQEMRMALDRWEEMLDEDGREITVATFSSARLWPENILNVRKTE